MKHMLPKSPSEELVAQIINTVPYSYKTIPATLVNAKPFQKNNRFWLVSLSDRKGTPLFAGTVYVVDETTMKAYAVSGNVPEKEQLDYVIKQYKLS